MPGPSDAVRRARTRAQVTGARHSLRGPRPRASRARSSPRPAVQAVDEFGLPRFFESDKIQVAGLIVAEYNADHSHWNSQSSLGEWLSSHGIPALHGIDTRMLTKRIRDGGAMLAKIEFAGSTCVARRERGRRRGAARREGDVRSQ